MLKSLTRPFTKPEEDLITEPSVQETSKNSQTLAKVRQSFEKHSNLWGIWLFLVLNLGGLGLVFVLVVVNLLHTGRIANKPEAVLVEKSDGTGFLVDAIPASQRTPVALQRFTSDILTALFTVSPVVEGGQPKYPQGIQVPNQEGGNKRITVNAYAATIAAISPDFRDAFLSKLAQITPQTAFTGNTQVILKLDFLGEPIPLEGEPGKWTVTVVGSRYVISGDSTSLSGLKPESLRQVVYLESVPPQFPALENLSTELQEDIWAITRIGLRIAKMVPLEASAPQGGDFLELPAPGGSGEDGEDGEGREDGEHREGGREN